MAASHFDRVLIATPLDITRQLLDIRSVGRGTTGIDTVAGRAASGLVVALGYKRSPNPP